MLPHDGARGPLIDALEFSRGTAAGLAMAMRLIQQGFEGDALVDALAEGIEQADISAGAILRDLGYPLERKRARAGSTPGP